MQGNPHRLSITLRTQNHLSICKTHPEISNKFYFSPSRSVGIAKEFEDPLLVLGTCLGIVKYAHPPGNTEHNIFFFQVL